MAKVAENNGQNKITCFLIKKFNNIIKINQFAGLIIICKPVFIRTGSSTDK